MNNVLRDIGSHTNISSYSTDTSAVSSSNDAGKKLFTFLQKAVSNNLSRKHYKIPIFGILNKYVHLLVVDMEAL